MPIDSPFDSLVGIRSPFGNRRAPDILLFDLSGNAIEDAANPDTYWAITPQQDEANP